MQPRARAFILFLDKIGQDYDAAICFASSYTLDGVDIIKEQDMDTKAIRMKLLFKEADDLADFREILQDPAFSPPLKTFLATHHVTYGDHGDHFVMTVPRESLTHLTPFLTHIFECDIAPYLRFFDQRPARPVFFTQPQAPHEAGRNGPLCKSPPPLTL